MAESRNDPTLLSAVTKAIIDAMASGSRKQARLSLQIAENQARDAVTLHQAADVLDGLART